MRKCLIIYSKSVACRVGAVALGIHQIGDIQMRGQVTFLLDLFLLVSLINLSTLIDGLFGSATFYFVCQHFSHVNLTNYRLGLGHPQVSARHCSKFPKILIKTLRLKDLLQNLHCQIIIFILSSINKLKTYFNEIQND